MADGFEIEPQGDHEYLVRLHSEPGTPNPGSASRRACLSNWALQNRTRNRWFAAQSSSSSDTTTSKTSRRSSSSRT